MSAGYGMSSSALPFSVGMNRRGAFLAGGSSASPASMLFSDLAAADFFDFGSAAGGCAAAGAEAGGGVGAGAGAGGAGADVGAGVDEGAVVGAFGLAGSSGGLGGFKA